jgi:hypothetical protein
MSRYRTQFTLHFRCQGTTRNSRFRYNFYNSHPSPVFFPAKGRKGERRRRDSNPRYPVKRYCGARVPWLFTGVQKSLQVGVFSLLSHRGCSLLFVWVGVSVGVNSVSIDIDQHV